MKNYYQILEVAEEASQEEIKHAYRRLAKAHHPDVNKSPDAHEKFCEITEAYEFLIDYWPNHSRKHAEAGDISQKYQEHQHTDAYEQFIHEAQERARRQARMRYEKFKKQHEAFQESGLNDIGLILTMIMRIFSLFFFLFMFFAPLVLAVFAHWVWIFTLFFMWPFALGIAWYYRDNKIDYFKPGKFYYSADRIRHMFTDKHPTVKRCYYCRNKTADSRP